MTRIYRLVQQLPKWLGVGILILSLAGCKTFFGPSTHSVKRVSDGDTIVVTDRKGIDTTVRFACIDAPEVPHSNAEKNSRKLVDKNQFNWGVKAQARVQRLMKSGGDRVLLTITDTDRYGRQVGEVRLPDNTLVQEVLVREGLALVNRPYLKNCPSKAAVEQAEAEAKKGVKGIWGDPKFTPPWEYRRIK